jgi:hypothetical protein
VGESDALVVPTRAGLVKAAPVGSVLCVPDGDDGVMASVNRRPGQRAQPPGPEVVAGPIYRRGNLRADRFATFSRAPAAA